MTLFPRKIPSDFPRIVASVAKELPWKLTADGAAAITYEAAEASRARKLLGALEPDLKSDQLFKLRRPSEFFADVDVRGSKDLEATTKFGTAKGIINAPLLDEVNRIHGLNARIPTEPGVGHMGKQVLKVPETNSDTTAEGLSDLPSAMDLIKRGDSKPGLNR